MKNIPALLAQGFHATAMRSTPDDPVTFELYWKEQDLQEYDYLLLRINKHKILRYLLDKITISKNRLSILCYCYENEYSLSLMHLLDKYPDFCVGKSQKRFCEIRLQCREIALALLCAGKLKKDYRDVNALIARVVWGMRGYCKIENEIIKRIRLRG